MRSRGLLKIKNIILVALVNLIIIISNFFSFATTGQLVFILVSFSFTLYTVLWYLDDQIMRRRVHGSRKNV